MRSSWVSAGAAAQALLMAVLALAPVPVGAVVAGSCLEGVLALGAAALVLRLARSGPPGTRRSRHALAVCLLAAAAGGGLVAVRPALDGHPPLDVAPHALALLALLAALCALPRGPVAPARLLLDAAAGSVGLWVAVEVLLLAPHRGDSPLSGAALGEATAVPVLGVVVVAAGLSVLARASAPVRREAGLLVLGAALLAGSDVARTAAGHGSVRDPALWVGVVVLAGLLVTAVATSERPVALLPLVPAPTSPWQSVLPVLPVLAATASVGVAGLLGRELGARVGAAVLALAGLLLLRQVAVACDRVDVDERLRRREELFRSLVTNSSDLITLHDEQDRLVYASPAVVHATGIAARELVGGSMVDIVHPEDRPALAAALHVVLSVDGSTSEVPLRLVAHDGSWRWHHTRMRNALGDPSVRGIVSNSRDVHERHVLQQQVAHAASHDALTGLGNLARARALLRQSYDRPGTSTVVLVDLDGFKSVNDTFGHADGDVLLNQVALRLRRCVRAEDEVTRIGGDEFLVVLGGRADGSAVAQRILGALREPLVVGGRELSIGASVGLATSTDAASPEELLRNADLAMYASKAAGRGRATWYQPQMHESAARRMHVQRGLRRALDEGHLALHYQPIVALPRGRVVGVEALLRWTDPELGPVGPDVFIPIAEDCGLMGEIDAWVLDRACADLAGWREAGLPLVPVSVNVSRSHLTADLPGLVVRVLRAHRLQAEMLTVEVTESAVIADPAMAIAVLQELRGLGVRVALDDFGTGESSLSQLARLPIDSVKIDKSFVLSSSRDGGAQRLLTSIIGVCRALELPVVAEGIEDGAVVGYLAANGCQFGQGYHFGRPGPGELVGALLRRLPVPLPRTSSDGAHTVVA